MDGEIRLSHFSECKDLQNNIFFSRMLSNGDEIVIEPCDNGFCVKKFDKDKYQISETLCTNLSFKKPVHKSKFEFAMKIAIKLANQLI